MRRITVRLIGLLLVAALMAGCSPVVEDEPGTMTIYATFYPIYALSEMITKNVPDLELRCLVQPQTGCIRSYSISDWDISILSRSADGIMMGGSGLESFEAMLQSAGETVMPVVEVLYGLDLVEESAADAESESHWEGKNPHLYMSVTGAMQIVENIAGSMIILDPEHEALYLQNKETALQALESLRDKMFATARTCQGIKTAVFNEALAYTAKEYQLDVVARSSRESGENLYGDALDNCLRALSESGTELILIEQQAPKALVDVLTAKGFSVARIDILAMHEEADGAQGYFDAQRANAQAIADACEALENQRSGGTE